MRKPQHIGFTDIDMFSKQIHATISVFPNTNLDLSCVVVGVSSTACKY